MVVLMVCLVGSLTVAQVGSPVGSPEGSKRGIQGLIWWLIRGVIFVVIPGGSQGGCSLLGSPRGSQGSSPGHN